MKDTIISELRKTRKKLDKEFNKNPQKVRTRWNKIEEEFNKRLVNRGPKLLKRSAA
jgi:hypothetical protein